MDRPAVERLVAARFGQAVRAVEPAGAGATEVDDAALAACLAAAPAPVLVLAEAFEAPTREVRGFLGRLRAAMGATRPVVVALVDGGAASGWTGPAPDDLRVWQRQLAALGDPYLRVEPLIEDAP
jgi:hypothetical protein